MKSNDLVVDASALAAVAFVEPEAPSVARRLNGARLHAPHILFHELANVAWKKVRREGLHQAPVLRLLLENALSYAVELHTVSHVEVFELALHHDLTAYDAAYLWLARSLEVPLVTLDRPLARAAAGKTRG